MKAGILRIAILFSVITGLGAVLLIGGAFYLESNHARNLIQKRLNQSISGKILWEKVRISLIRKSIEIDGIRLEDPSGKMVVGAEQFYASVSLSKLFSGILQIEAAGIIRPAADFQMDADGTLDLSKTLQKPLKPGESSPEDKKGRGLFPFNVRIQNFRITDGAFRFASITGDTTESVFFEKIDITLSDMDAAQKSGRFKAHLGKCSADLAGIQTGWEEFILEARMEKGEIIPVTAKVESNLLSLQLRGGGRKPLEDPAIDMNLKIETTLEKIRKTFHLAQEFSGPVKLEMNVRGKVSDPSANLILTFGGGQIWGVWSEAFMIESSFKERVAEIHGTKMKTRQGSGVLSAVFDFKDAFPKGLLSKDRNVDAVFYRIHAALNRMDFKDLPIGKTRLDGTLQSNVKIAGKGFSRSSFDTTAKVEFLFRGKTKNASEIPFSLSLNGDAILTGKNAEVPFFELNIGNAVVAGSGIYEWKSQAITSRISVKEADLWFAATLFGFAQAKGTLKGDVAVSGSLPDPAVDLHVQGRGIAFESYRIGNIMANLRYERGGIQDGVVEMDNGETQISIAGSVDLLEPGRLVLSKDPSWDLTLKGRSLRLKDFHEQMDGQVSFDGRMKGSFRHPQGKFLLSGNQFEVFGQKIKETSINARMQEDRVFLEPLRIVLETEEVLKGTGWLSPAEKMFSGTIVSDSVSLKHIHWLQKMGINKGIAALDISGKGSFEDPEASGKIILRDLEIQGKKIQPIRIQAALSGHVLQFDGESDVDIQGKLHLKNLEFQGAAFFKTLELAPYFEMAGFGKWSGIISGRIDCRGNAARPETIRGEADLSTLVLSFEKQILLQSRRFKAEVRDTGVVISKVRLDLLKQGKAEIAGRVGLDGKIDLSVSAAIPLSGLGSMIPEVKDIAGDVLLSGVARGSYTKPEVSGTLELKHVKIPLPDFSEEIQDINAVIRFSPAALNVETLTGRVGGGEIDVRGKVGLSGLSPSSWSLTLDASRISFGIPGTADLMIDGRLAWTGNPDRSTLKGEVTLEEGVYLRDVSLNPLDMIGAQRRRPEPVRAEIRHPILKNMTLDIAFRNKKPFVVDNNIALLNIDSDLHLSGSPAQPRLLGKAQVKEGTITFLGREFEIKRGAIDFINPYRIEPAVDIESRIEIRTYTILLKISGTPDTLIFTKSSIPPESDEDIMMLLLAGKTRREMIREKGGAWIGSKALAAQVAGGLVGEKLKATTGLDVFEARYLEKEDETQEEGVEVTVGKALSQRLTVKYTLETRGGETTQRASSEYRLLENVAASAFQENTGNYGAEMIYRLEFR
jgi:autotransporter translocation and assembly factor TamB